MPHSPQESQSPKDNHELINASFCDGNSCGSTSQQTPILDVHKGRPVRLQVKVMVPVHDHPNFNFVGKLLGPKGNSLKWLQDQTQTKMAILGRGSMRDKQKEEELRQTMDPKYFHLNEELHVEITAFAPAPEAYIRMGNALHEVKRFLVPDYYDDIRQQQLRELGILNVDKKANTKLRYSPDSYGFGHKKTNDCTGNRPPLRDNEPSIHQIVANDSPSLAVAAAHPHLVSPTTNGYSNNECLPFDINGENDADLSHCPHWDQKSKFKLSSRLNNKGLIFRDKPYSRITESIANSVFH